MAPGEYSLTLPPGTYTVTASKPGHTTQTFTAIVKEELTTHVDFQLSEEEVPPEEPTTSYIPILLIAAACIITIILIQMYRK